MIDTVENFSVKVGDKKMYYDLLIIEGPKQDSVQFAVKRYLDDNHCEDAIDESGYIRRAGEIFLLYYYDSYDEIDDKTLERIKEWVDSAIDIRYSSMRTGIEDTESRRRVLSLLTDSNVKVEDFTIETGRYGPGIKVIVDKVEYNNYKEEDKPKHAFLCGEVGEYTIIGSMDPTEFCIKSFTNRVSLTHPYCKSYRFIKTKYITRVYKVDINKI